MHRHASSPLQGSSFRFSAPLVLLALLAFAAGGVSPVSAQEIPEFDRAAIEPAVADLLDLAPDVRVYRDGMGATIFYGAPIFSASDSDLAVDGFWENHGDAFGISGEDRSLNFVTPFADDRATVYAYNLTNGPISIEGAVARLIVRKNPETGESEVIYAAARTALPPEAGYPAVLVPEASAGAMARLALPDRKLSWKEPALVITMGTTDPRVELETEARLAWHVSAHNTDENGAEAWTVIIDPTTGATIEIRSELCHVDVEGEVSAMVTPSPRPILASNPAQLMPLPNARVRILGGATSFSALNGVFTIPHGGTAPVTVESTLAGNWITINDFGGTAEMTVSTSVTPPGPVDLFYDPAGSEFLQAQLNGFHYGTLTHNFFRERTPGGIPGIDVSLPCNVNINDVCNATFDPVAQAINFFRAGAGCANTSFSNVISHEYGHFVVNRLGLAQGAFGEGFGDVVAMMLDDDPIIGRDFSGPGSNVRNPLAANVQYPCSGGVHNCGQILGASWWRIREAFGNLLGAQPGLELTQQMFVDWSLITIGGAGSSSASPTTAIEVLTIDDDDGFLDNGTPNFFDICDAFAAHSVDCPPIPPIAFSFDSSVPAVFTPQTPVDVNVSIDDGLETGIPSTAALHVRGPGEATFSTISLVELAPGSYLGTIPALDCGGTVEYFLSIETAQGSTRQFPNAGSASPFEAPVYDIIETMIFDDLETDTGWVAGAPGDTATAGIWERVNPVGTAAAPENDRSPVGTQCFVTGQGIPGGNLGANDVDGGGTTLTTPPLDLSAPGDYQIQYWRWFSNDTGAQANTEVFRVDVSNNGVNWFPVEVVGPTGQGTSGGWNRHTFNVASIVAPTATVRVRFIAADPAPGSLVEAAVDDFEVIRLSCDPSPSFQRGDVDGEGSVNLADAIALLSAIFAGTQPGCRDALDTNDSGTLDLSDAIGLLDYLFVTGPQPVAPFGSCGTDATDDTLDCLVEPTCQ